MLHCPCVQHDVANQEPAADRIHVHTREGVRPLDFDVSGGSSLSFRSAASAWSGAPFELHRTTSLDEPWEAHPPQGERHLMIILEGSAEVTLRDGKRDVSFQRRAGSLSVHAGPGPAAVRVSGTTRSLMVNLSNAWWARAGLVSDPEELSLHPIRGASETARSLALAMWDEASRGAPSGPLFADSLSLALVTHVLERFDPPELRERGTLSEAQAVRLTRHIDEHLGEKLRVAKLARLCGVSTRHFCELFRRRFGVSPHQYVLRRRTEAAAQQLARGGIDIAEVALRLGFSSQSHLTTVFKRAYGTTPRRYVLEKRRTHRPPAPPLQD